MKIIKTLNRRYCLFVNKILYALLGVFFVLCLIGPFGKALAQTTAVIPQRQIPPSVLTELRLLEHRFEQALAQDCAPERCFPKGCTYGDHTVADQPRASSLPGLGQDPGPGSVRAQEYLTLASCSFAYEKSIRTRDAQALVARLQAKLSKGWTTVDISREVLKPVPDSLRHPPKEELEVAVDKEGEGDLAIQEPLKEWELMLALRELWDTLLPHLYWMVALMMLTFAALIIIWAWRRLGKDSLAEQAMLAQMMREGEEEEAGDEDGLPPNTDPLDDDIVPTSAGLIKESLLDEPQQEHEANRNSGQNKQGKTDDVSEGDDDKTAVAAIAVAQQSYVDEQLEAWRERLARMPQEGRGAGISDLIKEWLQAGEMDLLAKAVLRFPDQFPYAFPDSGELANFKLELAQHLKEIDSDSLPSDLEFFETLNRHALSSFISSQSDTTIVRHLKEEFGSAGIAQLIGKLPPRFGALLYAQAPVDDQYEIARLLPKEQIQASVEQLLASNRIDKRETAYLFEVLSAEANNDPIPKKEILNITHQGPLFDASASLSVLLNHLSEESRKVIFSNAANQFGGAFPRWYEEILFPDMLLKLTDEARANVFLEVDFSALAAWLSIQNSAEQKQLKAGIASSLQLALDSVSEYSSREEQLSLASRGRKQLSKAMHTQLARANVTFAQLLE